ncbi:unnamed protein product [Paramecium sonneborni]|uniref:Uncharacterized protein n=1 Tax=Paramecium sonneborni TaxID=65129 RepID=A0A8S1R041_9CILI|nr:unnamed protein product [Paramecium sonneborni]
MNLLNGNYNELKQYLMTLRLLWQVIKTKKQCIISNVKQFTSFNRFLQQYRNMNLLQYSLLIINISYINDQAIQVVQSIRESKQNKQFHFFCQDILKNKKCQLCIFIYIKYQACYSYRFQSIINCKILNVFVKRLYSKKIGQQKLVGENQQNQIDRMKQKNKRNFLKAQKKDFDFFTNVQYQVQIQQV